MLKVGLTGGIGSGKTVVANIFRQLGVPVYDADKEGKLLTETNPEIKNRISNTFGEYFFNGDVLDREKLSDAVFSDKRKLSLLNEIIHPVVKEHFDFWLSRHEGNQYIIKEAAVLFESRSDQGLDKIITVSSPEELRVLRVMERDNFSREKIQSVMKNQWSDEEREAKSDFVVANDNEHLLIPQVLELHKVFSK